MELQELSATWQDQYPASGHTSLRSCDSKSTIHHLCDWFSKIMGFKVNYAAFASGMAARQFPPRETTDTGSSTAD